MHKFADVIVEVPQGSATAVVTRRDPTAVARPPRWMVSWKLDRIVVIGIPAGVLLGLVEQVGPVGPVVASVWLALNWWLY